MKHLLFSLALFTATASFAQSAHETAYSFMRTGDHDNAILVLTKAIQTEPENEQLLQDLALAYYYKKDFAQARTYAKKLADRVPCTGRGKGGGKIV
jgi:Tfp pilus assembly protein PilF